MTVAEGALRDGVLWDLLGRVHHRDIREVTVDQFARRYHVDQAQAQRVDTLAQALLPRARGLGRRASRPRNDYLDWAAQAARDRHLHRAGRVPQALGLHPRQRRHAGLLAPGAGMALEPGARAARQALRRCAPRSRTTRGSPPSPSACALAVIVYRSRRTLALPKDLSVSRKGREWRLGIESRMARAPHARGRGPRARDGGMGLRGPRAGAGRELGINGVRLQLS